MSPEPFIDLLPDAVIETRAHFTDATEHSIFFDGQDQITKVAFPRRNEPDDQAVDFQVSLDLDPGAGAFAGLIPAGQSLRHDAFQAALDGFLEEGVALTYHVSGEQE